VAFWRRNSDVAKSISCCPVRLCFCSTGTRRAPSAPAPSWLLPRATLTRSVTERTRQSSRRALLRDQSTRCTGTPAYGGDGALTRLLCGRLLVRRPACRTRRSSSCRVLRGGSSRPRAAAWLEPVLRRSKPKTTKVARGRRNRGEDRRRVRCGGDPRLARRRGADGLLVVGLLHDRPSPPGPDDPRSLLRHWTLELLAAHVGLRDSAATRFRRLTGDSPIRYLTKVRLSTLRVSSRQADEAVTRSRVRPATTGRDALACLKREFGQAPGRRPRARAANSRDRARCGPCNAARAMDGEFPEYSMREELAP